MPLPDDRTECGFTWALEDPNEEDVRTGSVHICCKSPDHQSDHRCKCGEYAGVPT